MTAFGWALLAAVVWGFCPLLEKAGLSQVRPMAGLFYRSMGVLIGLVLLALFWVKPEEIKSVDARSALILALAGFLASFVGQYFFYNALRLGEASRLAPIGGSYPFVTFIVGVLILGESATPMKLAGVVMIAAGVWLLKIG